MPMNEEVRKAVERMDAAFTMSGVVARGDDYFAIRAELTRLTEIADSVDPLVVRLGEVTTKLEAANALLRRFQKCTFQRTEPWQNSIDATLYSDGVREETNAHLSEPRT